jgi:4-amino-4-deoxy-L-arabinose transferase-like glycosyltransferase
MMEVTGIRKRVIVAVLSAILIAGAALRLHELGTRTMTHIEIYVPGIELPRELADPGPRFTVLETLRGLMEAQEPHPPAYYLFMLGWTRILGSGMVALRLPSVLFGVACVFLVYVLGVLERKTTAGLVAAAMLAFSGYQVFWSQLAKSYVIACFFGLLSTVLLILASREGRRQGMFQILYSGVTLIGLATSHYIWPILVTHMVWTLNGAGTQKRAPGLFRYQLITVVLGSPLISLAIFQARRPSYLTTNLLAGLSQFLQFGFLFEPDPHSAPAGLVQALGGVILAVVGLLLLRLGLGSRGSYAREEDLTSGPSTAVMTLAGAVAFAAILALARFTFGYNSHQTSLVVASSAIPVLVFAFDIMLQRCWERANGVVGILRSRPLLPLLLIAGMAVAVVIASAGRLVEVRPQESPLTRYANLALLGLILLSMGVYLVLGQRRVRLPDTPSALLALLPIAMLAAFLPIADLFASRGALVYTPYLLLVLSQGLVTLARRKRYWIVLAAILSIVFLLSVVYYRHSYHEHPEDYKALAKQWIPEIEDSDLIFVQRHWVTTPIFYYLDAGRYHFVGAHYPAAIRNHPGSRVWVVKIGALPSPEQMEEALGGYTAQKTIRARGSVRVVLYTEQATGGQPSR